MVVVTSPYRLVVGHCPGQTLLSLGFSLFPDLCLPLAGHDPWDDLLNPDLS